MDRQQLGRHGEDLAVAHLEGLGLAVVHRNWRCRHGELDVVAQEGRTLVFVEVKARRTAAFGLPAEAVGAVKIRRLRRLAGLYLAEQRPACAEVRFDVVSVVCVPGQPDELTHLAGAF